MASLIMREALKRMRGRKADKGMLSQESTKGMDSPDLEEKTEVIMGLGASEDNMEKSRGTQAISSDELAPSKKELAEKNEAEESHYGLKPFKNKKKKKRDDEEDDSDVGGSDDEAVFDEKAFNPNKKPSGIYERMQASLGKKLGKY